VSKKVTKEVVRKALANCAWDLGNAVLYDLCKEHPAHKTNREIIAKVWLIGRSYAAAIERHRIKKRVLKGDNFYEGEVLPKMKRARIDKWFAQLKKEPTPETAVAVHSKLTELFHKITKLEKRSLASKYLHFHLPSLFFIYDSRAIKAIRKITPSAEKILPPSLCCKDSDKEYAQFYRRCLWLQNDLKTRLGRKLSPRQLDKVLLYFADN
jgi:hypothetical protein